ncbi:MAG TPA: PaaI family thioesterase [Pseudonocardia sp.]|jgi:uncharacterized protein (TIGR00369 family)
MSATEAGTLTQPLGGRDAGEPGARLAAEARRRDGLGFLRAMIDGELPPPPIGETLGMRLLEAEPGRVLFELTPAQPHYNPIGGVHGGVYATLLDSATGCAVHSRLPAGVGYTSLDLTVKFLRGIDTGTGPVRCEGTVTHLGRRTALAQAEIRDLDGRLYATAISSILVLRPEPGGAG